MTEPAKAADAITGKVREILHPKSSTEIEAEYVGTKWVQNVAPMRTNCYRCNADSPIIHAPVGTIAFGTKLKRGERDITQEVTIAFATIGWRFQFRRAYCPTCKGLGSV